MLKAQIPHEVRVVVHDERLCFHRREPLAALADDGRRQAMQQIAFAHLTAMAGAGELGDFLAVTRRARLTARHRPLHALSRAVVEPPRRNLRPVAEGGPRLDTHVDTADGTLAQIASFSGGEREDTVVRSSSEFITSSFT